MNNRKDAIAQLESQGHHAFAYDTLAPGAFCVATAAETTEYGVRMLGKAVIICPIGDGWEVQGMPREMKMQPVIHAPLVFESLSEAVEAARHIICETT